jgi:hypothetical protein
MVNQKPTDLGIPNRFNLTPFRFSARASAEDQKPPQASADLGSDRTSGGFAHINLSLTEHPPATLIQPRATTGMSVAATGQTLHDEPGR